MILGKNIIQKNIKLLDKTIFAKTKYQYFFKNLKKNKTYKISKLSSFSIYVLDIIKKDKIFINDKRLNISVGDVLQLENLQVSIKSVCRNLKILIVGTNKSKLSKKSLKITKKTDIYKVNKPWGYELWLNGRHKNYSFKKIFLKKNFRTSLQFHKKKMETNVIFNGTAELSYKKNRYISNLKVTKKDISLKKLPSISKIFVKPNTIHRIKALTNLILYEASTPELDDVIRISDDSDRKHGLIKKEHKI